MSQAMLLIVVVIVALCIIGVLLWRR